MKDKNEVLKGLKEVYPNEIIISCLTCKHSVTNGEHDLRCGLTNTITTENHVCSNYTK